MSVEREKTSTDPISIHIREVIKHPLLTLQEEQELGRRIKELDCKESLDKLVQCNLRLVLSIARKYLYSGMPLSDLVSEGTLGLMRAAVKFDYSRELKFSSYATFWIKQKIRRFIAQERNPVKMPVHREELYSSYIRTQHKLSIELGRDATVEEIAKKMNVKISVLRNVLDHVPDFVFIDQPMLNSEGRDKDRVEIPVAHIDCPDDRITAEKIIASSVLTDKERKVLVMRYFEERTLDSIGKSCKLTRERVRQIEIKAIKKLRKQYHIKEKSK